MPPRLPFLADGLLLSLAAFGCASDPNKQASDAHDAPLEAERKQLQSKADNRSETRVNAAEAQRDNTAANATGTTATKNATEANANLTEDRQVYRAKAKGRLAKLDARTAELKALVAKAGGKASTQSRDALAAVDSQHAAVAREVESLTQVANDNWEPGSLGPGRAKRELPGARRVDDPIDDVEELHLVEAYAPRRVERAGRADALLTSRRGSGPPGRRRRPPTR